MFDCSEPGSPVVNVSKVQYQTVQYNKPDNSSSGGGGRVQDEGDRDRDIEKEHRKWRGRHQRKATLTVSSDISCKTFLVTLTHNMVYEG